ncbi:MAG: hypothetical protein H6591_09005 [Flavobacteriales bacterium]|nr:hypothetical protein [Flavobacteriales bacterium]
MIRLGFAILLSLSIADARAQSWEVFDMVSAGFPSNTVVDIVVEENGDAWVATDWGLCRQVAGVWSVFQMDNSGLPDNYLRAVAKDHEGRIWIGTSVAGAAVFDGSDWVIYDTGNSPLPDNQVNTIHVDHNGWVWLGTVNGLACYTGSEWRLYNDTDQSYNGLVLNTGHIIAVDTRSDGLVALGTLNGGFHFLTDTAVHYFTTFNSGFFDNTQRGVLLDTVANERWLACPAGALVRQIGDWYGGTWFQYTTFNSDLPTNALVDLARDSDGALWLAGQVSGLVRRDPGDSYSSFTTSNSGIPSNNLNCVTVAPDGAIWVGTYDGGAARMELTTSVQTHAGTTQPLSVVPSINQGSFRVLAPGAAAGAWEVRDLRGSLVANGMASSIHELRIDLGNIVPGTYFLRVQSGGNPSVARFIAH